MKNLIILVCCVFLMNCESVSSEDFMVEYQREICDKYSLYAKNKDLEGHLSLYTDDAMVNNSSVEPITGKDQIKQSFLDWYEGTKTIDHSAKVISAKVFGNEAFAYGTWRVDQIMKDGTQRIERGHWSTHNVKIGNSWKMTIDHTNDAEFYESRNSN